MSFYLQKNVLVTGASSGIGRALCLQLAKDGARVFAVARNKDKLNELTKQCGNNGIIIPIVLDITQTTEFREVVQEISKYSNKIDIIINNAGIGHYELFLESNIAADEKVITTNVIGTISFLRFIYLNFMKQGNENYILFTTSLAGKIGFEKLAVYSATKFALEGFAESLRRELKNTKTTVTVFRPGIVETNFFKNAGMVSYEAQAKKRGWMRRPEEVASYLLKKIPTKKRTITVGGDKVFLKLLPFIPERFTFFVLNVINKLVL